MTFLKFFRRGDSPSTPTHAPISSSSSDFREEVLTPVQEVLHTMVLVFYFLAGSYSIFLIWKHLNYIQVDLAGHMASGAWFKRGFFHQYQDANFLGYVHGLFYPPLEDFILTGLSFLTDPHPVAAYQLYLTLLAIGVLSSSYLLGGAFKNPGARDIARLLCLGTLWISKGGSHYFQGMSFDDMHITGLSSQILGGVFFFLFLREWLGSFRPRWALCFLALCILSHIVVAMVAVSVLMIGMLSSRERLRPALLVLTGVFVVSAFYLVPFIFYKSQLTASRIFGESFWQVSIGVYVLVLVLLRSSTGIGRTLLICAALLHFPNTLGNRFSFLGD
ncbi:MAG: hypothetical protein KGQ59_09825, partial [Bdellovibrionales bacterium]|nr:hypothetical protein [Bdellovibrionales bacterium]